jgi:hypothetical protein
MDSPAAVPNDGSRAWPQPAADCGGDRADTQACGGHLRPDTRPQFRTLGLDLVGEESGWVASAGGGKRPEVLQAVALLRSGVSRVEQRHATR